MAKCSFLVPEFFEIFSRYNYKSSLSVPVIMYLYSIYCDSLENCGFLPDRYLSLVLKVLFLQSRQLFSFSLDKKSGRHIWDGARETGSEGNTMNGNLAN